MHCTNENNSKVTIDISVPTIDTSIPEAPSYHTYTPKAVYDMLADIRTEMELTPIVANNEEDLRNFLKVKKEFISMVQARIDNLKGEA